MLNVEYEKILDLSFKALTKVIEDQEIALRFAKIFVENSLEGVGSHGLNRLPRYIRDIEKGLVNPNIVEGKIIKEFGGVCVMDGECGLGPLVGESACKKAEELADTHGIGMVALRNNSHWLRAGRYVKKMAKDGYICFVTTNTCMNLSAFGAKKISTGNNPIGFGIPYKDKQFVCDMALSQYAFGKLELAAKEGKVFDVVIGLDKNFQETKDPKEILDGGLMYPMALHKGSALSIMIDFLVSLTSNGRSSLSIGDSPNKEKGVSQIYVAISTKALENYEDAIKEIEKTVEFFKALDIHIPGSNIDTIRQENMKKGVPVNESTYEEILKLAY